MPSTSRTEEKKGLTYHDRDALRIHPKPVDIHLMLHIVLDHSFDVGSWFWSIGVGDWSSTMGASRTGAAHTLRTKSDSPSNAVRQESGSRR